VYVETQKSFIFLFWFLSLTNNGRISNKLYYIAGDMPMAEELNTITTSKEYMAFKLATRIFQEEYETKSNEIDADFRKHYLDLYDECLTATDGRRKYST
jgi:hypothetical protein